MPLCDQPIQALQALHYSNFDIYVNYITQLNIHLVELAVSQLTISLQFFQDNRQAPFA